MRKIDDRVRSLMRPTSSVQNNKEIARSIDRKDLERLNQAIAKQIEDTERERRASWEAALRDTTLYH